MISAFTGFPTTHSVKNATLAGIFLTHCFRVIPGTHVIRQVNNDFPELTPIHLSVNSLYYSILSNSDFHSKRATAFKKLGKILNYHLSIIFKS